jgi:hypothetical protein
MSQIGITIFKKEKIPTIEYNTLLSKQARVT